MTFLKSFNKYLKRIWDGRYLNHEIRNKLRANFGVTGYWYPLSEIKPPNTEYFKTDVFLKEYGKDRILGILKALNNQKINEINESRNDETISIEELDFDNDESFYCNENVEWVIYFSHERTITIGGCSLLDELKRDWANWGKYNSPWGK